MLGLVNGVILSEGLETMSDDLHPQHSVRDTIALGLALCVRLEFKAASRLLAVLSYGMQDNCCIAHWLAVIVLQHNKLEGGRLPGIVLLVTRYEQRGNEEHANDRHPQTLQLHKDHSRQFRRSGAIPNEASERLNHSPRSHGGHGEN